MKSFFATATLALLATSANAFSAQNSNYNNIANKMMSRSTFVTGLVLAPASAALARDLKDSNFDGTESASNAKTCMDRCMYEKLKQKGVSKKDAAQECSAQCEGGEGQLTSSTPPTWKGSN